MTKLIHSIVCIQIHVVFIVVVIVVVVVVIVIVVVIRVHFTTDNNKLENGGK